MFGKISGLEIASTERDEAIQILDS